MSISTAKIIGRNRIIKIIESFFSMLKEEKRVNKVFSQSILKEEIYLNVWIF
jgi:hypothetical protein